ncbi:Clavaminate synthase-like protein [Mycena floridula]|nr:Clavaminate synthase-like protein [Mycena floridula]
MPVPVNYPPFPDDIPVQPLVVIDYALVKAGDPTEMDRLWQAGIEIGYWYLSNHDLDDDTEEMFDMAAETMHLPLEEKMKFEQGDSGSSFGYKAAGQWATDYTGTLDTIEFLNISRDDVVAWPNVVHRTYPSTVNARMTSTIIPYITKSMAVAETLVEVFNEKLGLPAGEIMKRHLVTDVSSCETRSTRNPPNAIPGRLAIGAHSDFGSLTILQNRLGGLQVLPPGSTTWTHVKPIPGLSICNLGDAMVIFSGGILRSNLHRVIPPPGVQNTLERYSLGYFMRPSNDAPLCPISELSPMIAEANEKNKEKGYDTGCTAFEWISRRVKFQRINNRTKTDNFGDESWKASRGTEAVEGY